MEQNGFFVGGLDSNDNINSDTKLEIHTYRLFCDPNCKLCKGSISFLVLTPFF